MFAALEFFDYCVIALIVLVFAGGGAAYNIFRPADRARILRLERKIDLVLSHLGIEYPNPTTAAGLSEEVRKLADEGNKIQAIKVHRDQTGLALIDAKEAVEAYINRGA
jgi:ribosomal protein L7/L12